MAYLTTIRMDDAVADASRAVMKVLDTEFGDAKLSRPEIGLLAAALQAIAQVLDDTAEEALGRLELEEEP